MVQKVYDNTTTFDISVFVLDIIQRIIDDTIKDYLFNLKNIFHLLHSDRQNIFNLYKLTKIWPSNFSLLAPLHTLSLSNFIPSFKGL